MLYRRLCNEELYQGGLTMNESILTTIKKMLGIAEDYDAFDTDIIVNINTVFMTLTQIGVGPDKGFSIKGKDEKWSDFISEDDDNLEGVKTYIYIKVKLVFDPPTTSFVLDALKNMATELEWRLNIESESNEIGGESDGE